MKQIFLATIALGFIFSANQVAAEEKTQTTTVTKTETAETTKKSRKKKVEMCAECGKPETQCECDHAHEEKK